MTDIDFTVLNKLRDLAFDNATQSGFNDAKDEHKQPTPEHIAVKLALIHSEVSEALEALRKSKYADRENYERLIVSSSPIALFSMCIKDTFEDEIADTMIRLFDLAGDCGIDLAFHVEQKLIYNRTRGHKHGGKLFRNDKG